MKSSTSITGWEHARAFRECIHSVHHFLFEWTAVIGGRGLGCRRRGLPARPCLRLKGRLQVAGRIVVVAIIAAIIIVVGRGVRRRRLWSSVGGGSSGRCGCAWPTNRFSTR